MPRITKVYTRTGDEGRTGLGSGRRVEKDAARIDAYGEVDELNSVLGLVRAQLAESPAAAVVARIQNELFHLGSDLCVPEEDKERLPVPVVREEHVRALEAWIDEMQAALEPLANFVRGRPPRGPRGLPAGRAPGGRARPGGAHRSLGDPLPEPPLRRALRRRPVGEPAAGRPRRALGQPGLTRIRRRRAGSSGRGGPRDLP